MFSRLALACLLLTLLGPVGCRPAGSQPEEVRGSRLIMGTVVAITLRGEDRQLLEDALAAAFAEMDRIEDLMSARRAGSDVARINAAAGPVTVAPETAAVIREGLRVAAASGGAFDLALGRLKALWNLEGEAPRVPDAAAVTAALAGTGPEDLILAGTAVRKADPRLEVDLGGIAKGYAVDRAVAVLEGLGVRHAAVNAGGDMGLLGDRGERPWRIGIQHPRRSGAILATLQAADEAVVTSGDYERYFERDGVRYHHLFDPRSGHPARRCQAVTIVAPRATLADALATAVFVLGPERGLELLAAFPEAEGLVVALDGTPLATPGLAGRLTWP